MLIKTSRNYVEVAFSEPYSESILWELVVWLCLTFRQPSQGDICLSTCEVNKSGNATLQQLSRAAPGITCCWFGLFVTATITVVPGIKNNGGMVMETSFHMLLQLAAVEYPVLVDGGLVLMGHSTALVPVKSINNEVILWHLETAKHDCQLKATELSGIKGDWWKTTNMEHLQTKKALLGWCPEAITLLGTGQLNTVEWSSAKTKQSTWTWKGANLQFIATSTAPLQLGPQAGLTFDRSVNTLRFSAAKNYLKCLSGSAKEQIILYDVVDARGWLVPLICVFHEMLLAYGRSIPIEHRGDDIPLANPSSDGAAAALSVLRNSGGVVLEGSQHDRLTVRDLILGFSCNLSRTMPRRASRSEIYGYEFMDIMMDSHRSELKRCQINSQGLPWVSLLEKVNCLFCSNLGDAIRGFKGFQTDSPCNQLLKGRDWLAASMHSINELNTRHGGGGILGARRLSDQHLWLMKGSPFQKCEHGKESQVSCWESSDLFQEIQVSRRPPVEQSSDKQQPCGSGAVVFGRPSKFRAYIDCMRSSEPKHKRTILERPAQNSGAPTLQIPTIRQHDIAFTVSSNDGQKTEL